MSLNIAYRSTCFDLRICGMNGRNAESRAEEMHTAENGREREESVKAEAGVDNPEENEAPSDKDVDM